MEYTDEETTEMLYRLGYTELIDDLEDCMTFITCEQAAEWIEFYYKVKPLNNLESIKQVCKDLLINNG